MRYILIILTMCLASPAWSQAEILPPWGPIPAGSSSSTGAGGTITPGTAPFVAYYSAVNVISSNVALQFPATEVVVNEVGDPAMDFRVECDNEAFCLFVDSSADDVILNDGGTATFNFRVEGDTSTQLLFIDAAADDVIINDDSTATATFRVECDNEASCLLVDAANDDVILNDGGAATFNFRVEGDTVTSLLFIDASADDVIINDDGLASATFRVEGDTNANLIFTDSTNDAVGIGTGAPNVGALTSTLLIQHPNGTAAGPGVAFSSAGNTDNGFFLVAGDTPGFSVGGAERMRWTTTAMSNQGATGNFNINYTNALATPAYSFAGDTNAGYRWNANDDTRIVANGVDRFGVTTTATSVQQGAAVFATNVANVGGVIETNITAVGNVGAGTDDLMTFSLAANSLDVNAKSFTFKAWGTFAGNANAKTLTAAFGATTLITTGSVVFNTGDWQITGTCIRTGAATQDCVAQFSSGNAVLLTTTDFTTPAETLSGAVTIKLTGTATSDNDIVQEGWIIYWDNAN